MAIGFRGDHRPVGDPFVEHPAGKNVEDRKHRIARQHRAAARKKFAFHRAISFAAALFADHFTRIAPCKTLLAEHIEAERMDRGTGKECRKSVRQAQVADRFFKQ